MVQRGLSTHGLIWKMVPATRTVILAGFPLNHPGRPFLRFSKQIDSKAWVKKCWDISSTSLCIIAITKSKNILAHHTRMNLTPLEPTYFNGPVLQEEEPRVRCDDHPRNTCGGLTKKTAYREKLYPNLEIWSRGKEPTRMDWCPPKQHLKRIQPFCRVPRMGMLSPQPGLKGSMAFLIKRRTSPSYPKSLSTQPRLSWHLAISG